LVPEEKPVRGFCAEKWVGCWFHFQNPGGRVVKLTLRDKETAQEAVRRFRKLVERSGIKKEMRVREFYEKPSEIKRRARLRAQRRSRRERTFGPQV
jgi:small subunit ribosomal protein S21